VYRLAKARPNNFLLHKYFRIYRRNRAAATTAKREPPRAVIFEALPLAGAGW
jgi:hypothetical protein